MSAGNTGKLELLFRLTLTEKAQKVKLRDLHAKALAHAREAELSPQPAPPPAPRQKPSPDGPAQEAKEKPWPCSACGKPARIEEVDAQGRTFWTCSHCQATGVTPREPGRPCTPQDKTSPLAERYQQTTRDPFFDDFPLVDAWLADNHPTLWQKIRDVDDELTRMDEGGFDWRAGGQKDYQLKLNELLALCQKAKEQKDSKGEVSSAPLLRRDALLAKSLQRPVDLREVLPSCGGKGSQAVGRGRGGDHRGGVLCAVRRRCERTLEASRAAGSPGPGRPAQPERRRLLPEPTRR